MSNDNIIIKEAEATLMKEKYKFKIVIVGDTGVGKTNLVKRFVYKTYNENTEATIGVEFFSNNYLINDILCKIDLWDTGGQERYKSITSAYYKGASGAIIVYDVTSSTTFNNVEKWLQEIKERASRDIKIIMVGNKTDLENKRVISKEVSKNKAADLNIPVIETSALNASNVKEAFHLMIKEIYNCAITKIDDSDLNNKNEYNILDSYEDLNKKKGCCF
jgi:small GTP-binding protein